MVSPAAAVKVNAWLVEASWMVVTEPAVSGEVVLKGTAAVPFCEV